MSNTKNLNSYGQERDEAAIKYCGEGNITEMLAFKMGCMWESDHAQAMIETLEAEKSDYHMKFRQAFENGYDRKVTTEDLDRFYEYCIRKNVDRIIVGHLHPKEKLEIDYKGKHLTVCKRGLTELEI